MKQLLFTLSLLALGALVASAADLPAADAALIEAAGVPLYPGATFATGSKDAGFRFATSESPATVRQWYREKLASWSIFDKFDSWTLHDGDAVKSMGELMSRSQVQVQRNDELPEWHELDKSMTTEIMIKIVE